MTHSFKRHIARSGARTFCSNNIAQPKTYDQAFRLNVGTPQQCNCRPCLTNYYLANPLILKRTRVKAAQ